MKLNDYQNLARSTAIYPKEHRFIYPVLGLCGEAGEVAEKVKKVLRDGSGRFGTEDREAIAKELGDICWYIANLSAELGYSLEEVAKKNIDKLQSRKRRGKIQGSGDDR